MEPLTAAGTPHPTKVDRSNLMSCRDQLAATVGLILPFRTLLSDNSAHGCKPWEHHFENASEFTIQPH